MSKMRLSDNFSTLLKVACDFKRFIPLIEFFLAKRGRRPRVAGFIILSLKGLRRDEISCGVYGHLYLFISLFICEVGVCRK